MKQRKRTLFYFDCQESKDCMEKKGPAYTNLEQGPCKYNGQFLESNDKMIRCMYIFKCAQVFKSHIMPGWPNNWPIKSRMGPKTVLPPLYLKYKI